MNNLFFFLKLTFLRPDALLKLPKYHFFFVINSKILPTDEILARSSLETAHVRRLSLCISPASKVCIIAAETTRLHRRPGN